MSNDILSTATKFMQPVIDSRNAYKCMTEEERIKCIKEAYGLSHGKGKSKRKKKRK